MRIGSDGGGSGDAGLLARARNGDLDALESMLEAAAPVARAALDINSKWRSTLDADDVMQVTYLEAFLSFASFKGNEAAFPAWLRAIAVNNLRDAISGLERAKRPPVDRRLGPRPGEDSLVWLYQHVTGGTNPSSDASRDELRRTLESALDQLPPDYAEVIRLIHLQELPLTDVAKRMERSYGAVHLLWRRGLDRMAGSLGVHASTLMWRT